MQALSPLLILLSLAVYLPTLSSSISTGSPATSLRLKRILLKYSISRTAAREEAIPHGVWRQGIPVSLTPTGGPSSAP
ncbi:hypothetical protein SISNIDRAFT_457703 [Sistotremastrum niveocremeum HHB9708]|uniref:Uncharacterized protein n=2 Tax=Sistotremastraceae TaxID=3402574 RepID=A0A164RGL5_9AGAM|nr:hypothetical protein SISNIDRAFT_457703 [Sistotremastrum niveocremeum HHB9708]KZT40666.1 hypothetical protein SISSUDRAFT_1044003 [Sistotremastrum suecicum HHB10207 ss-3]